MNEPTRAGNDTSGGIRPLDIKGHEWRRDPKLLAMVCARCGVRWMPHEALVLIGRCRGDQ